MKIVDILKLEYIRCETDFEIEVYCIECGQGGHIKRTANRMYFYEGYGPLCNSNCLSDMIGVPRNLLPPIKNIGRLK